MNELRNWIEIMFLAATPITACRVTRQCSEDISVKGFTFPKGLVVNIPIYYLHNNPEHWPEPDKFDPNR